MGILDYLKHYISNSLVSKLGLVVDGICQHKIFVRWVQTLGCNLDAPDGYKNASAPVGMSLKRGSTGTSL